MSGAVHPRKPRIIRLQLQFFSQGRVGINVQRSTRLSSLSPSPGLQENTVCTRFGVDVHDDLRSRRRAVATAGRSYGGPSEKFVVGFGAEFSEVAP